MIPRPIGLGARLAALHAASFGGIGIYVPFFPIWLESRGLPASWIGIVLALPIVVRVLVTAPLITLADRSMGARRLIAAACLGVSVIYLTLLAARDPVVVAVLVIFMAVAQAPIIPNADLVTIQAIRREPRLDYGRLRLWGSIAFLIASIGGGYFLEVLPADAVIWFLFSLAICAMATAWAVVPDSAAARVDAGERPPALAASGKLPLALWFVIGAGACTQASHGALYAFGSIHWRDLGFSSATIGLLWAIGVVAEILVFAFLGRGVGRGSAAVGLILVGAGAGIFRSAALAAAQDLPRPSRCRPCTASRSAQRISARWAHSPISPLTAPAVEPKG